MPQMTSKTKSVGEIFTGTTKFEVPKHQRDYSWTAIEVEELFTDIESTQAKSSTAYYIGMLVLVEPRTSGGRYQILDGQQRLTTLTLLFAAARDWCSAHGLEADKKRLQAEFIGFADYGQEVHDPRIVLNSNNRQVFEQFVVNAANEAEPADLEKTNALLLAAKRRCGELLSQSLSSKRRSLDQRQKLYDFIKYIRDSVQATVVEVSEPEDASHHLRSSERQRLRTLDLRSSQESHLQRAWSEERGRRQLSMGQTCGEPWRTKAR